MSIVAGQWLLQYLHPLRMPEDSERPATSTNKTLLVQQQHGSPKSSFAARIEPWVSVRQLGLPAQRQGWSITCLFNSTVA
jgi:hypothetical protein